jgi:hypothetical protein
METNNQSRTLYIIQVITLVVLILLLITQALPFFGINVMGKPAPVILPKGGGGYTSPSNNQTGMSSGATPGSLVVPPLVL